MNCLNQILLTVGVMAVSYGLIAPHARRINAAVHPFFERLQVRFKRHAVL